jgi:hypothetical protein
MPAKIPIGSGAIVPRGAHESVTPPLGERAAHRKPC